MRLLLALAGAAGVLFPLAAPAAIINVTCSGSPTNCTNNLNQVFENAASGDTINIGAGTYTAQTTLPNPTANHFYINKRLQVSGAGPGATILRGAGGGASVGYVVLIYHGPGGLNANNTILENMTLEHGWGAVQVHDFQNNGGGTMDNVTVRNIVFTPTNLTPSNNSHGVHVRNSTNSRVIGVNVTNAYHNGIFVYGGSNNMLAGNTVGGAVTQHAIALSNTSGAIVTGNTVTSSFNNGIIALGVNNSRFERNNLSGHRIDGITLTNDKVSDGGTGALSFSNFVGHNRISTTSWAGGNEIHGTGIWLNGQTDGNYVYANSMRGAAENGFAIFGGSYNYIQGNRIHGNYQGGMLIWNRTVESGGSGGRPVGTRIFNNYVYYNPTNAMVNQRDTQGSEVGWNFFSGANFPGDPANPAYVPGSGGVGSFTPSFGGVNVDDGMPNTGSRYFRNTFTQLTNAVFLGNQVTNESLFHNKFYGLGGHQVMDFYSNSPATVSWDAGATMGGNFFQGHAVSGNPSNGSTPFTDIYCPGPVGCTYRDNYPFASDNFGQSLSVAVNLPRAGSQVAAGSLRTIQWDSKGCSLVDLHVMNGASVVTTIVTNYPDVGHFVWNVGTGESTGSRTIRVTCKNISGASVGVTGSSGAFTVFPAGLTLLAPGPYSSPTASGTMTVAWLRGGGVTDPVNVYASVDGGPETALALNASGNHAVVSVPNANSNRVVIRIQTEFATHQDSTDGYFRIVRATGQGFSAPAGGTIGYGTMTRVEWRSIPTSRYVDLELCNAGPSGCTSLTTNVPDFGHYEWFVPATAQGNSRVLRLTFRATPGGGSLGQVVSGAFNVTAPPLETDLSISQTATPNPANVNRDIVYDITVTNNGGAAATGVGVTDTLPASSNFVWASPGCTHSSGTVSCNVGSLAIGASATVRVVIRRTASGTATNTVSVGGSQGDPAPGNNASALAMTVNTTPAGVPILRYRLYSDVTKEHHFTTDQNEYNVLGTQGWVQEGTVGRILNNPGSHGGVTATPYYRLYDHNTRWHHWTTDANEYYTLGTFPGWVLEGVDGWILPTAAPGTTELFRLNYPHLGSLHQPSPFTSTSARPPVMPSTLMTRPLSAASHTPRVRS